MNKRIDFSLLGGLFTYQDTFAFLQDSYSNAIAALAKHTGEKIVLTGCVDNGVTVTDGVIAVNGECIPFTGGAIGATIVISETVAQESFADGSLKDVYYTKTASFGIGGFPYADLKRLPFDATTVADFADKVNTIIRSVVQLEDEVILEGLEVSNVLTGPSTLDIAAGAVLFSGKLVAVNAYSGTYPVYLKENGGWDTAVPGSGLYITFNPYTSQRYVNVLDRAQTPAGRIIMMETLTDRFDPATFVGRWEMKGYELVAALQNRVPVGLWFDGVAVTNVTDALNTVAGNQYGERQHTLTEAEMPVHDHNINGGTGASFAGAGAVPGINAGGSESAGSTEDAGGGDPHNNMQPSTVVVYAKRTA